MPPKAPSENDQTQSDISCEEAPPKAASDTGQSVRVLHVDDDASFAEMADTFLERINDEFTVVTETSARDGLDRLHTGQIDCIVSDYQMPGMNGLEFLEAVREEDADIPFILFTGRGSEEVASDAIAAGVTDYLQKEAGTDQYEVLANRIHNCVTQVWTQQALDDTEEEFRHLVDAVVDYAIFMLDPDGYVTSWNRGAEEIKGYRRDEIIGEHFSVFYPETDRKADRPAHLLAEAAVNNHVEDEGWRVRKDGSQFWANVTITALHDDGDVRGFAKITRDMTDRREYQQGLERQIEQIEELLRVVTHDLQNPVSVAQGNLELARESGEATHFETVETALDRIATIIDEMLVVSQAGILVSDPSPVALADVADQAWELIETDTATLVMDELGTVEADAVQLQSIFENLFQNAVTPGGDVTVTVGALETGFYVADDGPGIPAEDREKDLEYGYSTRNAGTGSGLSIVQQIADAHGWTTTVTESDSGGARSEFTGVEPVE